MDKCAPTENCHNEWNSQHKNPRKNLISTIFDFRFYSLRLLLNFNSQLKQWNRAVTVVLAHRISTSCQFNTSSTFIVASLGKSDNNRNVSFHLCSTFWLLQRHWKITDTPSIGTQYADMKKRPSCLATSWCLLSQCGFFLLQFSHAKWQNVAVVHMPVYGRIEN